MCRCKIGRNTDSARPQMLAYVPSLFVMETSISSHMHMCTAHTQYTWIGSRSKHAGKQVWSQQGRHGEEWHEPLLAPSSSLEAASRMHAAGSVLACVLTPSHPLNRVLWQGGWRNRLAEKDGETANVQDGLQAMYGLAFFCSLRPAFCSMHLIDKALRCHSTTVTCCRRQQLPAA